MTKAEALNKAMRLCSTKEYAVSEMLEKLATWGMDVETDRAEIMRHLQEEKFLDEFRLARFYVNDKLRFNRWGRIKIKYMLQQKKVDKDAIAEALKQITDELYIPLLVEELVKKRKAIKDTDPYIV